MTNTFASMKEAFFASRSCHQEQEPDGSLSISYAAKRGLRKNSYTKNKQVMKRIVFALLLMPFVALAQPKKSKNTVAAKPSAALQASITRGQAVYGTICVACHQSDGTGVPGLNPPLIQNNWVLGPKNRLISMVLNGSHGKVEINGEAFQNVMPPMAHLSDQEIADVITCVRNSFGNKASAVSTAEVKVIRAKSKK